MIDTITYKKKYLEIHDVEKYHAFVINKKRNCILCGPFFIKSEKYYSQRKFLITIHLEIRLFFFSFCNGLCHLLANFSFSILVEFVSIYINIKLFKNLKLVILEIFP